MIQVDNISEEDMGVSKIRGTLLEVPITRMIVFGDLYWGTPILGSYQFLPFFEAKILSSVLQRHPKAVQNSWETPAVSWIAEVWSVGA